jgi:hypothetical protein
VVFGSCTVCCTLPALPFARHHGQSWAGNRGSHTPDSGGVLADPKFKIGDMGVDPGKSYVYIYICDKNKNNNNKYSNDSI